MSNARNLSKIFSLSAVASTLLSLGQKGGDEPGIIKDFAGPEAKVPAGYLLCDGRAVSRTTYAALYDAIGVTWGAGDGSTTFNLPDLRGRTTAGKDNMGGTAASRLTTAAGGVDGATLGATGGASTHTLTVAQMPQHNHAVTDPGHAHSANVRLGFSTTGGQFPYRSSADNDTYQNNTGSATTGISIQNNGSSQAHPNVQPTAVVNKIIKT